MNPKITIRLDRGAATSTTTTEGFRGGECIKAAAPFAEILGEVKELEHTDEFYQESQECQIQE